MSKILIAAMISIIVYSLVIGLFKIISIIGPIGLFVTGFIIVASLIYSVIGK